jgi:hypothetical protein
MSVVAVSCFILELAEFLTLGGTMFTVEASGHTRFAAPSAAMSVSSHD